MKRERMMEYKDEGMEAMTVDSGVELTEKSKNAFNIRSIRGQ